MSSFLQKFQALKKSIPIPAVRVTDNENCKFVDYTHYSKNCFYCIFCQTLENSSYCEAAAGKELIDCDRTIFSELCYECVRCINCYRTTYSITCHNCSDCQFCYDCIDCKNCFGCVGLTRKQFCILNNQLNENEYYSQLDYLKTQSSKKIFEKVNDLLIQTPQPASHQFKNENCPYGDFINESKNVYWAFDVFRAENSGYLSQSGILVNCWDGDFSGGDARNLSAKGNELCYEMCGTTGNYHCAFLEASNYNRFCYHSAYLNNCEYCLGCVGLKNKKYCILNNQLSLREYKSAETFIRHELNWKV